MNGSQTELWSLNHHGSLTSTCCPKRRSGTVYRESSCIILLAVAIFISGCSTQQASVAERDYYYLNPSKKLMTIGRVTIVELDNDSTYPQISTDITKALYQALQKKQVFGLTIVHRYAPSWRSLQLDGASTYNAKQITAIRKTLKCDGLLIGTITEFRPYPHMAVGLRLKLLDLRDGQLLWALEQVWDSSDKTTERDIQSYFKSTRRPSIAPLREQLVAVSPLEFIKFVSYEVAETL
jgi:hypothetical protein